MNKYLLLIILFSVFTVTKSFAQFEINPDDRDLYIQKAGSLFKEYKWELGKEVVDKGLKKYPKDSDLRGLNGKYYLHIKDYETARYELKKALEYNEKNVGAKQTLINVEMGTKRYSSAISYVNELLQLIPYDKTLWLKKAEAYRLQGNIVESNRLLKRIRHIYPEDKTLKENTIDYVSEEFYSKKGKAPLSEIEELALYIINEEPQNEEIFLGLINSYIQYGNYEKALLYAERASLNIPHSIAIIKKRNSILARQNRYQEILTLMKELIREQGNIPALVQENDYYMEQTAQYVLKSDPYHLYKTLFEKYPGNVEYFNNVYTTALSRALYDDVIEIIKLAKSVRGETKDLLLKELYAYKYTGNQSKQRQVIYRIATLFPDDVDIRHEKSLLVYKEAKEYMSDRLFLKAIPLLDFVIENGDEELLKPALISKYNCLVELGREEAESIINQLIVMESMESDWRFKKSVLLGSRKQYTRALYEYEEGLRIAGRKDMETTFFKAGYEEQAAAYTKDLLETYRFDEATVLIDRWLEVIPESKMAVNYGYNISSQMKNIGKTKVYLIHGLYQHPEDLFFQLKLADVYMREKNYAPALDILSPLLQEYPYHKETIAAYSQLSLERSKLLLKETKTEEVLQVLDKALIYDPENTDLKYMKGIAFEKLHIPDSAFYYQSFYTPSLIELKDHQRSLMYLAYIKNKNEASFLIQSFRFADNYIITSVAEAEYSRIEKNNIYTGRFFYTGRDNGKGIMFQGEWNHKFSLQWLGSLTASVGTKIFPKYMISPAVYYTFRPTWEAEFTVGLRNLADSKKMLNQQVGLSKDFNFARFTGRFNSVILDDKWHYNIFGQSRFYIRDYRSHITVMGGFGSAPDIEVIDNQFYNAFSATNSMVAVGAHFILSEYLSIDPFGAWYNYKVNESLYRNIYSLQLRINVRF